MTTSLYFLSAYDKNLGNMGSHPNAFHPAPIDSKRKAALCTAVAVKLPPDVRLS